MTTFLQFWVKHGCHRYATLKWLSKWCRLEIWPYFPHATQCKNNASTIILGIMWYSSFGSRWYNAIYPLQSNNFIFIFVWKQVLLEWNKTVHFGGNTETVSTFWLSGTFWLIVIWPQQLNSLVFTDQGPLIFRGFHPPDCSVLCSRQQQTAGFQLEGCAWWEAVITRALLEVFLLV